MKSNHHIDIRLFGDPIYIPNNNAPLHKVRNEQNWLDEHDVQGIQRATQSHDLNVIKTVWNMLPNKVMRDRHSTKLELKQCSFRT